MLWSPQLSSLQASTLASVGSMGIGQGPPITVISVSKSLPQLSISIQVSCVAV